MPKCDQGRSPWSLMSTVVPRAGRPWNHLARDHVARETPVDRESAAAGWPSMGRGVEGRAPCRYGAPPGPSTPMHIHETRLRSKRLSGSGLGMGGGSPCPGRTSRGPAPSFAGVIASEAEDDSSRQSAAHRLDESRAGSPTRAASGQGLGRPPRRRGPWCPQLVGTQKRSGAGQAAGSSRTTFGAACENQLGAGHWPI